MESLMTSSEEYPGLRGLGYTILRGDLEQMHSLLTFDIKAKGVVGHLVSFVPAGAHFKLP
jgi:hypothetical protein